MGDANLPCTRERIYSISSEILIDAANSASVSTRSRQSQAGESMWRILEISRLSQRSMKATTNHHQQEAVVIDEQEQSPSDSLLSISLDAVNITASPLLAAAGRVR